MTFRVAVHTDLLVVSGSPGGRMDGKSSQLLDDVPEVRLAGMAEIDMRAFAAFVLDRAGTRQASTFKNLHVQAAVGRELEPPCNWLPGSPFPCLTSSMETVNLKNHEALVSLPS